MPTEKFKFSCRICIILISLIAFSSTGAAWWNDNWDYKKSVYVADQSGSSLSNYQVKANVDTFSLISNGKMQSDCSDMRWVNADDSTTLDYWIEEGCNTDSTTVWVEVPSIAASSTETIYMYYGNSPVPDKSNGFDTFVLFDDFNDGSLDTNKWNKNQNACDAGSISESNGNLEILHNCASYSGYGGSIHSANSYASSDVGYAAKTRFKIANLDGDGGTRLIISDDWDTSNGNYEYTSYLHTYYPRFEHRAFTTNGDTERYGESASGDTWYTQEISRPISGKTEYFRDGTKVYTETDNSESFNDPLVQVEYGRKVSSTAYFDFLLVRKVKDSEPTVNIGSESQRSSLSTTSNTAAPAGSLWIEGQSIHWTDGSTEYWFDSVDLVDSGSPGDPGALWIESSFLHWIDENDDERRRQGNLVNSNPEGPKGSLWIENGYIHYIDGNGEERVFSG